MLKKLLISLMVMSAPSVTVVSSIDFNNSQNHYFENLRTDIINNSINLEDSYYTEYDGVKFYGQDELDGYIYQQSGIESVVTSSNPSKIIKDYENQILDENKIFDINIETAKKVYRDAFGNVALNHQDALNTYTHPGLVKEKYSYDAQEWFNSPEEAKIYEKNNLDIYKSIFQLWDNNFYNAFNLSDMERLISNFKSGVNVNITKNLEGVRLSNPYTFIGSESEAFPFIKSKLFNNFISSYYSRVTKMEYQNQMRVAPTGSQELRIHFSSKPEQDIYYGKNGESYKLIFANTYSSYNNMVKDFKDVSKWKEGSEGSWGIGRIYAYRTFTLINPSTNRAENVIVKILPKWSHIGGKNRYNFEKYNYFDETSSVAKVYLDVNKQNYLGSLTNLPKRYSVSELEHGERQKLYDIWFENYFRDVLTKFYYKNSNETIISSGTNVAVKYEDVLNQKLIANLDNSVYKDLYFAMNSGNGKNYSFLQSYFDFLPKKLEILNNPKNIDGVNLYELRPDYYVSKEDLEMFIPFEMGPSSRVKYFQSTNNKLTDIEGKLLSNSKQEALEKAFINDARSLKKRYIAYDVFGNSVTSGESEEDAIRTLQQKILTESKFVSIKEFHQWNPNYKINFTSIISDGRYIVYRVKNPNNIEKFIYYNSLEKALLSVKSSLRVSDKVVEKYVNCSLYNFTSPSGEVIPIIYFNYDIEYVIDLISNQYLKN